MQDIHVQYHQPSPWFLLASGDTYTSSNMPQKQNPGVIQETRGKASDVIAAANAVSLRSHNVTPGMVDYKESWRSSRVFVLTVEALAQAERVMKALRVNKERALEELNQEWTTSVELAEHLQMKHGVPFRVVKGLADPSPRKSSACSHLPEKHLRPTEFGLSNVVIKLPALRRNLIRLLQNYCHKSLILCNVFNIMHCKKGYSHGDHKRKSNGIDGF